MSTNRQRRSVVSGSAAAQPQPPRVALLLHTSSDWTRSIIRGIAETALDFGGWDFFIEPRGYDERISFPRGWKGDAVIARLTHSGLERALRKRGLPFVNVSWAGLKSHDVAHVVSDEQACGRLAAEHFLQLGFRSFAFVGSIHRDGYGDTMCRTYKRAVQEAGHDVHIFQPARPPDAGPLAIHRPALIQWIRSLPKPTAVFAWNSEIGREVAACGTQLHRRVPDDLAILVSEYDQLLTSLAPVPFSNIDQAPSRIGKAAAHLLNRLLAGDHVPAEPIRIPPVGIVQRRSTQTAAVEDSLLAAVVRWLHDNSHRPIQVADLERQFQMSRRTLEQRFQRTFDSTPSQALRGIRLQNVKRLLCDTTLPLSRIATLSGFNHVEVLIRTFHREFGATPGEFRRSR